MSAGPTLRQAAVIVTRLRHTAVEEAARRVRRDFPAAPPDNGDLRKLDGDIWAIDRPLGIHRDATKAYHRVFGVVLVNDPGLVLLTEDVIYDLPVGTVYHINGRKPHAALAHNAVELGALFGFLAWDVPQRTALGELLDDLIPSLEAYARGEPRVNVLADGP
jgi:hypothetical protein